LTKALVLPSIQHFIYIPPIFINTKAFSTIPPLALINHSFSFLFVISPYLLIFLEALFIYVQFTFVLLLFSADEVRKFKELHVLVLMHAGITADFS
jgi:hypothetical protein